MKISDIFTKRVVQKRGITFANGISFQEFITSGYRPLSKSPEIIGGCLRIAELIASMTIYLMANTEKGDKRIVNELSRKIDIEPNSTMTRHTWMTAIVMNLLLYGDGNSIVFPHTKDGLLGDLEPISATRVGFSYDPQSPNKYAVLIDNKPYDPDDLLHFVINPDDQHLWMGQGFKVALADIIDNLTQASATKKGFMQSKWKPSLVIKVDGVIDEFSNKEGRSKILKEYVETSKAGEPFILPAEQFDVKEIRPLTLNDLAINDSVNIDKKTASSILGVPPFVLGVGEYKADEWDSFINNTIRPIAQEIEQEMTRKLLISNKMFLMFNMSKLYSYDLQKMASVYGGFYDKGIVTGNEVRDKIGMQPLDGLDELIVLENYIPVTEIGNQKKLGGND